jgi:hypothetical protein
VNTLETGQRLQHRGVLKVGDKVRTTSSVKLACLASLSGRVVELNNRDPEVGVKFAAVSRRDDPTMWFGTSELEAGSSPQNQACASIAPKTGFLPAKHPERLDGYSPMSLVLTR